MRLGAVLGVLTMLVSGCTSADAGDGPHGRYLTVDACLLASDQTLATLSTGLPKAPQETTGGPNSLPYDLSVCRFHFGSVPTVATTQAGDRPSLPDVPAYRIITITAYRYNANRTQSAAQRADILIRSLASTNDVITSPHRNLDRVYLHTYDDGLVTKAEVWALAGNVVLDIAYDLTDRNDIPPAENPAENEDDARNGILALLRDAASRLTCTSDNDTETC